MNTVQKRAGLGKPLIIAISLIRRPVCRNFSTANFMRTEVYFYDHIRNALANPHQILFPCDEKVMQEKKRLIRLYESQDGGGLADLRELENRYYGCRGRVMYAEAYTGFQPVTPGKNRFFDELDKISY